MSGDIQLVCKMCGEPYLLWSGHVCPEHHSGTPQRGWICPVCGRGNAPWNPTCDCERVADPTHTATVTQQTLEELNEAGGDVTVENDTHTRFTRK